MAGGAENERRRAYTKSTVAMVKAAKGAIKFWLLRQSNKQSSFVNQSMDKEERRTLGLRLPLRCGMMNYQYTLSDPRDVLFCSPVCVNYLLVWDEV